MGKLNQRSMLRWLNRLFERAEQRGLLPPIPAFEEDHSQYPGFRRLEEAWPDIRAECERLLAHREAATPISALGGAYTSQGIHTIDWKSFVLVAGEPIAENCALCPKTAAVLASIPDIRLAFFSILEPHQYVRPHWGYYKGLLRYHLGVIIPDDNREGLCWLRMNTDEEDNRRRDTQAVTRGEKYYWRNGKGVFFDDTRLHDAANESDEVRVVLWIDLCRRFPWYLDRLNRALLWFASRSPFARKLRANARLDPARFTDTAA